MLAGVTMGPKTRTKAKTIDEYLAALSSDKRAALERLRGTAIGAKRCR
jgi:hypothetical protein